MRPNSKCAGLGILGTSCKRPTLQRRSSIQDSVHRWRLVLRGVKKVLISIYHQKCRTISSYHQKNWTMSKYHKCIHMTKYKQFYLTTKFLPISLYCYFFCSISQYHQIFGIYHVSPACPISPYHLYFSANITISPKKSQISPYHYPLGGGPHCNKKLKQP